MLGLINRSIQCFLRDTYGGTLWARVACTAGFGHDSFESMLDYPAPLTDALIDAAAAELGRPRETVLEDLGTYLVSNPNVEGLRRLLRFGGAGFVDFLHSLEDLPDRGRLALPDLVLPPLTLADLGDGSFRLTCGMAIAGCGHVVVGMLRAMADDYGALVLIEHEGPSPPPDLAEVVSIRLLDQRFTSGRHFSLAVRR